MARADSAGSRRETCDALLSAGRGMTMDQAVAYALQGDASAAQQALTADARPVTISWAPLTAREQEVARLVASGMANRQIASKLVVTPATAAKHVEHIREKLGLTSRMRIAARQETRSVRGRTHRWSSDLFRGVDQVQPRARMWLGRDGREAVPLNAALIRNPHTNTIYTNIRLRSRACADSGLRDRAGWRRSTAWLSGR
jgi:DNA-binding CsgD family transcriptional regulator